MNREVIRGNIKFSWRKRKKMKGEREREGKREKIKEPDNPTRQLLPIMST